MHSIENNGNFLHSRKGKKKTSIGGNNEAIIIDDFLAYSSQCLRVMTYHNGFL